jgi:hypothetical protein
MRSQHVWKEKDEEGRKREVRVTKFGGQWRFQSQYLDNPGWTYHEPPLHADVVTLRDILFRKYQRRRASAEDVASIDEMLRLYADDE